MGVEEFPSMFSADMMIHKSLFMVRLKILFYYFVFHPQRNALYSFILGDLGKNLYLNFFLIGYIFETIF